MRQVLGVDVAQKELVACLGRLFDGDMKLELYGHRTFPNNKKGFESMVLWAKKFTVNDAPIRYVMEATGVYHESLAYFLEGKGHAVSIVLPNKISNYARTLDVRTVTDRTASEAIARFGLERKLENWQRPKEIFRDMKQLTRERDQVIGSRTVCKNQLHAEETQAFPNKKSVARTKALIKLLNKQEAEIKKDIVALVNGDKEVAGSVAIIRTIPGVGLLTAATVLAESNGFELIRSKRQLTSFAGLDVKEKLSGTSVKGKPKISKKGNRYLRKAMYLPALSAIRCSETFKATYERLLSKHGVKMKAGVAVQRKLLELIYILYTTKKVYDKNFIACSQTTKSEQVMAA